MRFENIIRKKARKLGYGLNKAKSRSPYAEATQYHIYDIEGNFCVAGCWPLEFSMSLKDVTEWLDEQPV